MLINHIKRYAIFTKDYFRRDKTNDQLQKIVFDFEFIRRKQIKQH